MQSILLEKHALYSHKLIHIAMAIIISLASAATLILALMGKEKVSLLIIGLMFLASNMVLGISWFLASKSGTQNWTKYLSILSSFIVLFVYQIIMKHNSELFITFFILIMLSVIYIDIGPVIFSTLLAIFGEGALLIFWPVLVPQANVMNILGGRFTIFVQIGIIAYFCARIARKVLMISLELEGQSREANSNLSKVLAVIKEKSAHLSGLAETMNVSFKDSKKSEEQVGEGIQGIAQAASLQAKEAHSTAEIVNQITDALTDIAQNVEAVSIMSTGFRDIVNRGLSAVNNQIELSSDNMKVAGDASHTVTELNQKSTAIVEIVELISGIAGQTNLLALNAAIEAARAGEQGRGFAVVSEEVRKLAEESAKAANKIASIIHEIQQQTDATVKAMDMISKIAGKQEDAVLLTQQLFNEIEEGSRKIDTSVQEVSAAVQEMLASSDEVVRAVENISAASQQTAASTQQIASSAQVQVQVMENIAGEAEGVHTMATELEQIAAG
ncbi:MAG: methyl-accepting chemotaxis protein [Acidobacteriota bacterium]